LASSTPNRNRSASTFRRTEALLLGRRTYEIFVAHADRGRLRNSQLLGPDVPAAVEKLRAEPGGEIRVWGSTELIRTLAEHDLVDEYRLAVYPLVLGTGKKLFSDGFALARLTLVETRALPSGVLVNTYRRSDAG
jgi:dihydrofolate reductase